MILSTIFMVLTIIGINWMMDVTDLIRPAIVDLLTFTITGIVVYLGSLWIIDKSFVVQTKNMVRKALTA